MLQSILRINQAIRAEAFAGMPPAARGAFIDALEQMKENLAVGEPAVADAAGHAGEFVAEA